MSSFFRRPEDLSSDDSSNGEEAADVQTPEQNTQDAAEDGIELATTQSLSTNASLSQDDAADQPVQPNVPNAQHHRDMMFATLLEEWCKTRAAELLNSTNGDNKYQRLSPEIQDLAQKLYREAGQTLATTGFLPPAVTSEDRMPARQHYLAGLDGISLRALEDKDLAAAAGATQLPARVTDNTLALVRAERRGSGILGVVPEPTSSMILQTGRQGIGSLHSEMQLTYPKFHHSHYESSFQQMNLLGKGGFGKVYHAYNVLDRKEYAVKKIPLSPKLSRRYRESGHQELESMLREVQALAELEHPNIVRYHATWMEEPNSIPSTAPDAPPRHSRPIPVDHRSNQKLLDFVPYKSPPNNAPTVSYGPGSRDHSDGIVFGYDEASHRNFREVQLFSKGSSRPIQHQESSSFRESEMFTDGQDHPHTSCANLSIDSSVYVLHVQMSMYPMTLAQYLFPAPSGTVTASSSPVRRHCFHVVPALKILLGILCGLQYIHARGLIHRDIKPGNIFLSSPNHHDLISEGFYDVGSCASCPNSAPTYLNPRIGDFGLVAELANSASENPHSSPSGSKPVGTEYYRPPGWPDGKSSRAHAINEKLDVFALGVILVEMLWACGTTSERMQVLKELQKGRLPEGLSASIHAEGHQLGIGLTVGQCVRGMIEKDPEQRWTCRKVKECVEDILKGCRTQTDPEATEVKSLDNTKDDE